MYIPVDMYIPSLTYSMTSILCLGIHCRIPITIVKYNSICSCKIYTDTSRSRRQNETKYSFISIKSFHQNL